MTRRAHCVPHQCGAVAQVQIVRRHRSTTGDTGVVTVLQPPTWMCTRCIVKVRRAWGRLPTNGVLFSGNRIKTSSAFAKLFIGELRRLGALKAWE